MGFNIWLWVMLLYLLYFVSNINIYINFNLLLEYCKWLKIYKNLKYFF